MLRLHGFTSERMSKASEAEFDHGSEEETKNDRDPYLCISTSGIKR